MMVNSSRAMLQTEHEASSGDAPPSAVLISVSEPVTSLDVDL